MITYIFQVEGDIPAGSEIGFQIDPLAPLYGPAWAAHRDNPYDTWSPPLNLTTRRESR